MKQTIILLIFLFLFATLSCQVFQVNHLKIAIYTSTALGMDLLNNYVDRQLIEKPFESQLAELKKNDLNFIDHWSWQPYSKRLKNFSDYSAFLTLGLTAVYAYDDFYWLDNLMVFSQIMITQSAVCKWTKTFSKRYRPFVYDPDVSIEKKQERNTQHSFYSMHASTTFAASTFAYFCYSKLRGKNIPAAVLLYSPAAATAFLRVASGNHFFSDVVVGALAGSAISYFICESYLSDSITINIGINSINLNYEF